MGANCSDGVVLVGDRRITVGGGADFSHGKKIFSPYGNIIVGSSGYSGMYRSFQARLKQKVIDLREEKKEKESVAWGDELILLVENVIRDMSLDFGSEIVRDNFQVLLGFRVNRNPELILLGGNLGIPQPVTNYESIGHGDPYASVLVKILWNKYKLITMKQFAKLGCLTIKYIQNLKLDFSVGIDVNNNELPQVYYIPKIPSNLPQEKLESLMKTTYKIRELNDVEIMDLLKDSDMTVSQIKDVIEHITL